MDNEQQGALTDADKSEVIAMINSEINSASSLKILAAVESIASSLRVICAFVGFFGFLTSLIVVRIVLSILKP